MKYRSTFVTLLIIAFATSTQFLESCKKDPFKVKNDIDVEMYNLAKNSSGFVWFANSDALLPKSSGSGHSQPFLKTRYNTAAANHLDANGRIISGASFSEGSMIVKELYTSDSKLDQYAILYKNPDHDYADANGWVWGYMKADGEVVAEAAKKGESCISCHSQSGSIDYMLMNKFFPSSTVMEDKNIDSALYAMSRESIGFVWYGNSDSLLNKSSGTGHSQPFLRTRYNSVAAQHLDANGKVVAGTSFGTGSLIVKELFTSTTTFDQYAILYKQPASENADENGWVWGYLKADGSVVITATNKGAACISCHSQSESIDYMLMNKFFP